MIFPYDLSEINDFFCYPYEWIDDFNYMFDPEKIFDNFDDFRSMLKSKFLFEGWDENGVIKLIWIPPFALGSILKNGDMDFFNKFGTTTFKDGVLDSSSWTRGLLLFHVKNLEDGISLVLSPLELLIPNCGLED